MLSVEVVATELFFQLLIVALATFGLWCLLRLLAESALGSPYVLTAVWIRDRQGERVLSQLLEQARAMLSYRRRSGVVVLYDAALSENGEIPEAVTCAARAVGARCMLVPSNEDEQKSISD